eukprot:scaffold8549_cov146-Isochrysis_galbana.AAC.1
MGGGCKGCRPPDTITTTCSGLARFQCTLPPTQQAPPAMPPALCTKVAQKHPPCFSSVLPSSPCPARGLMDGGRMQRVPLARQHLYMFWFGAVPMHTPTHTQAPQALPPTRHHRRSGIHARADGQAHAHAG